MVRVEFQVVGKPATQGSKKAMPIYGKGGRPVMKDGRMLTRVVEDNPRLAEWRQEVAAAARRVYEGPLLTGAIFLTLVFERPRPKGHYGTGRNAGRVKASAPPYPTTKPDSVKLARAVEDALTGVLWQDDSQVVDHIIRKRWGDCFRVYVLAQERPALPESELSSRNSESTPLVFERSPAVTTPAPAAPHESGSTSPGCASTSPSPGAEAPAAEAPGRLPAACAPRREAHE